MALNEITGAVGTAVEQAAALGKMAQWDLSHLAAMAAALGFASGLRLYMVVFLTGIAGYLGWVPLPPGLTVLQNPAVLVASFVMLSVEFFADKVPALDSLWDSVHTFIRIPAGAALAFGALSGSGGDAQTWALIAALAGGTLAATSHAAKTTTRAAVNTSPEPFSNVALSLAGDAAVPATLWLAYEYPNWFWPVLAVMVVLALVVVVVLFRFLRGVVRRLTGARPALA
jgi:Domain of unknown function (DUF4126)